MIFGKLPPKHGSGTRLRFLSTVQEVTVATADTTRFRENLLRGSSPKA